MEALIIVSVTQSQELKSRLCSRWKLKIIYHQEAFSPLASVNLPLLSLLEHFLTKKTAINYFILLGPDTGNRDFICSETIKRMRKSWHFALTSEETETGLGKLSPHINSKVSLEPSLLLRKNKPSSLSISSQKKCSSPLDHLNDLCKQTKSDDSEKCLT